MPIPGKGSGSIGGGDIYQVCDRLLRQYQRGGKVEGRGEGKETRSRRRETRGDEKRTREEKKQERREMRIG